MKKFLLSILFITALTTNAQTVLIEDGFEAYDDFLITGFGAWETLDLDMLTTYTGGGATTPWPDANLAQAYIIFNPTACGVTNATTGTEVRNFDPHTGVKYAACWAGVPDTAGTGSGALANEDWLISPPVTLGASLNELRVWVKSMSNSYGLEQYSIGVYVGSGSPTASSDFTMLPGLQNQSAPYPAWQQKIAALNTYANQTIRIGIRCSSADAYMFMVDDFKITTATLKNDEFFSSKFSTYPNPATNVVNISSNEKINISGVTITDLNGRTVKNVTVDNLSQIQINVADLNAGVYFMNINSDAGKAVKKFIKS